MRARSDAQPRLLRKLNARRVMEVLRENGPCSRADITRLSGISAPTVSKVVTTLLDSKILEEGHHSSASLGRPGRLLRLSTDTAQVFGLVLDVGRCTLVRSSLDGRFTEDDAITLDVPDDYDGLVNRLTETVSKLRSDRSMTSLGIGISTPGLIHRTEQRVILSPNLPMTDGRSIAADLQARLGLDCIMVQESHALCLAERMYGAAKGYDHFAMMDATTGLGLGVMDRGELIVGHRGLAGEIGHITIVPEGRPCGCGNRGCLETVSTDTALALLVGEQTGHAHETQDILDRMGNGHLDAHEAIEQTADYLAIAVAAVINLFNPQAVFVLARMFDLAPTVMSRFERETRRRALNPSLQECTIARARGSKLQGAVAGILHHLTDSQGPRLSQ